MVKALFRKLSKVIISATWKNPILLILRLENISPNDECFWRQKFSKYILITHIYDWSSNLNFFRRKLVKILRFIFNVPSARRTPFVAIPSRRPSDFSSTLNFVIFLVNFYFIIFTLFSPAQKIFPALPGAAVWPFGPN